MGAQLRHHFKLGKNFTIREMVSVSQGEGRNVTDVNLGGYQYTSRLEILPFGKFQSKGDYIGSSVKREEKPKLALGGTYDLHDRAVKTKSNQGKYMENVIGVDENGDDITGYFETDITTIFADMMFKKTNIPTASLMYKNVIYQPWKNSSKYFKSFKHLVFRCVV